MDSDSLVRQTVVSAAEHEARRRVFPRGASMQFADLEQPGREGTLDELRAVEPVSWIPALGCWLVTSREAAREVLAPRSGATVQAHENLVRASLGRMMLTVDGDEHTRLRSPFEGAFKPHAVHDTFTDAIEEVANELLDEIVPAGATELGVSFAAPFAVLMAGRTLGLSLGDARRIDEFYASFARAMVYDGDPLPQARADQARVELDAILHAEVRRARRHPSSSITSLVARDADGLSDDDIVAQLRVIMFGAVETIQASILSTLLLLLQHPTELAAVRADPSLLTQAGEEARRLIPPVAFFERWTTRPLTIADVEIPANEFVGVSVIAVNRDPATFTNPLRFDLERTNSQRSMSFAFGPHACLGLHLARLETSIALRTILERTHDLTLVDHTAPSGFAFRRPSALHLSWAP